MTDQPYSDLRALLERATAGEWMTRRATRPVDGEWDYAIAAMFEEPILIAETFGRAGENIRPPAEANAALIVALRNQAPALLADIDGLTAERDEWRDAMRKFVPWGDDQPAKTPAECVAFLCTAQDQTFALLKRAVNSRDAAESEAASLRARIGELESHIGRLFDTEGPQSDLTILDLAYTAFMSRAEGKNTDDGGPCDWFTDTRPLIVKGIAKMRSSLAAPSEEGGPGK